MSPEFPHPPEKNNFKKICFCCIKFLSLHSMLNQIKLKEMKTSQKQNRKKHLRKGFLSSKDEPTFKAIETMYIYIKSLPFGWNHSILNMSAVRCVQKHFGVNYGFGVMIKWGIQHGCCKSKTSSGRHTAMSKAYILALSLVNSGVIYKAA